MKHLYPILLILAILSLIFNFIKLQSVKDDMIKFTVKYKNLKSESEIYLNSLVSDTRTFKAPVIISVTNDTISLSKTNKPCLCYCYSSLDCMSCVEENIYRLFKLAASKKFLTIYIITEAENKKYINMMSKVHNSDSLIFSYCPNNIIKGPSFYFMIFKNGNISNKYYPKKGESQTTLKYLNKACIALNQSK